MIIKLKEKHGSGYEWIDLTNPTKAELRQVAESYDLHMSLVEDCLQPEHLPKYEVTGDIQFVLLRLHSAKAREEADTIQEVTDKIAVFIGNEVIITIHRPEYPFLSEIKTQHVDIGKATTPYQILFRIATSAISTYDQPLAGLLRELDLYEPMIFLQKKAPSLLKDLYYVKRKATVMDYIFELTESVLENLKGKIASPHFNLLKDQILKHKANTRQIIDNVSNLLNIYISLSSQRTNDVVRVLTLFSVFFLPLTFIAGIYGMNFDVMPELRWQYGYLYAMLSMVVITVSIYLVFRRRGWL